MDPNSTGLLATLIIGGIVGWLASILMKTNAQMGIVANVLVGIVGSFLGVALANALNMRANTAPAAWVVSIVGAVVLIAILRALGVFNRRTVLREGRCRERSERHANDERRTPNDERQRAVHFAPPSGRLSIVVRFAGANHFFAACCTSLVVTLSRSLRIVLMRFGSSS